MTKVTIRDSRREKQMQIKTVIAGSIIIGMFIFGFYWIITETLRLVRF